MEIKVSLNSDNGKKAPAKVEKVINYTELRTLKSTFASNKDKKP